MTERDNLLRNPPRDFSVLPFWFWNDVLSEQELLRQIADFEAHGVYGFVIHPRVGLPRDVAWMSDAYLRFCQIACDEARRRDMKVILYDEGMYPSGSSSGQVVAADPSLACRGLELRPAGAALGPDEHRLADVTAADGRRFTVVDRKIDAYIRGLHYVGDESAAKLLEDEPPAGDILNPRTVELTLKLVHDKYYAALGEHFGSTILGMFTDEPSATGKCRERDVRPGTSGILEHARRLTGIDFTPHLPALWLDEEPDAKRWRKRWNDAISLRLEETWFGPLSRWCASHGIALCGHPEKGDQLGVQRHFHIPGQDIVWRFIEREKPSALEGPESTQGKVTSSVMVHLGRSRNSNEYCGAYGHEATFEEQKWLADWLLVRGVNLLVPHAFYYSVRGPRKDERPPQLGPWTPEWEDGRFKAFADHARRLSWLNSGRHVCDVAILTDPEHAQWAAPRVCFEHQRDFNYLDPDTLIEKGTVADGALRVGEMKYRLVVVDGVELMPDVAERLRPIADRVVTFADAASLLAALERHTTADVALSPASPNVRVRHVVHGDEHFYLLFNENGAPVDSTLTVAAAGARSWVDTSTGEVTPATDSLKLAPYEMKVLRVS